MHAVHDRANFRGERSHLLQHGEPTPSREGQIQNQNVPLGVSYGGKGLFRCRRFTKAVERLVSQYSLHSLADDCMIVGDQDLDHVVLTDVNGTITVIKVPSPGLLSK